MFLNFSLDISWFMVRQNALKAYTRKEGIDQDSDQNYPISP